MPAAERSFDQGSRRASRLLRDIGEELRDKRLAAGLSQKSVAEGARISRSVYSRLEGGKLAHLSIRLASQVAAVLGLDFFARLYPGPSPLRDVAQLQRLNKVLRDAALPLTSRTEVGLPQRPGQPPEQRAWDAAIYGYGLRTVMELEMRLRDTQALERRIELKLRDDPPDGFVLLVADTEHNRRVLREHPDLFARLPRLRASTVLGALKAGRHPPTGMVFV